MEFTIELDEDTARCVVDGYLPSSDLYRNLRAQFEQQLPVEWKVGDRFKWASSYSEESDYVIEFIFAKGPYGGHWAAFTGGVGSAPQAIYLSALTDRAKKIPR